MNSETSPNPIWGVLLLAHGAPNSLEDIEPFLANIRGGRPFSPELLHEIKERYRQIGGSPLSEISRRQAGALESELQSTDKRLRVYLGMRNWHPYIRETMEQIVQDRVSRLLTLCLTPQNSRMSVGLYFQRVREAQQDLGAHIPALFVESWHTEPLLIDAFAEKLESAIGAVPGNGSFPVIFTAHSLPRKILSEGDPYDEQVRDTASAVAARCRLGNWRFAYQSQGATSEPWLGPTVEETIQQLSAEGHARVLLAPIGFVADHVEILYDIDIAFQKFAQQRQITLHRTESLNDSPTFIGALASVVKRQFGMGC